MSTEGAACLSTFVWHRPACREGLSRPLVTLSMFRRCIGTGHTLTTIAFYASVDNAVGCAAADVHWCTGGDCRNGRTPRR